MSKACDRADQGFPALFRSLGVFSITFRYKRVIEGRLFILKLPLCNCNKCVAGTRPIPRKGRNEMSWIVRYGGWTVYEGDDEEKANEEYRACGPYGTIREVKE